MTRTSHTQKLADQALKTAIKAGTDPDYDPIYAIECEIDLLRAHQQAGMTAEDSERADRTIQQLLQGNRRFDGRRPCISNTRRRAA